MFKKLGYKYNKYRDRNKMIEYCKEDSTSVLFWIKERKFSVSEYCKPKDITVDEFKAIQQQLKELGWIEEKNEIKQYTNIDHYKDGIVELYIDRVAISKGKAVKCCEISCSECDFKDKNGHCIGDHEIMKWFDQPYKKPTYKLTQCEYDMLDTIFEKEARFSKVYLIGELKKKGYFENIKCDSNVRVKDILANCEVVV